jgi:hypothetical protein
MRKESNTPFLEQLAGRLAFNASAGTSKQLSVGSAEAKESATEASSEGISISVGTRTALFLLLERL